MTTKESSTESKTESESTKTESTGYESNEETNTDTETTTDTIVDDGMDEFGYAKVESEETVSTESESEDKKEDETEEVVETQLEGYDKEEETEKVENKEDKKEDEKVEETEEEKTEAEKLTLDLTESINALPEGYDKGKVLEFAEKNGFSNDQVKAYVEMENVARADHDASSKIAVTAQKKEWNEELRNDKTFGGENFDVNLNKVKKTLQKHFPNLGKSLTDTGGMMPPYLMRDLLSLSKTLNPTNPLVNGGPSTPPPKEENFLDEMYK